MAGDGALHFAREAAAIVRLVERHIIDDKTARAKFVGEMAHGGEDERDLLLVMADVGRLVPHLHHQHDAVGGIAAVEAGDIVAKLVAEDGHEHGHVRPNAREG
jgi:hypothetical protein